MGKDKNNNSADSYRKGGSTGTKVGGKAVAGRLSRRRRNYLRKKKKIRDARAGRVKIQAQPRNDVNVITEIRLLGD